MDKFAVIFLLLCSSPTFAGDASHCIQLGATDYSQTIINGCAEEITVFWCHDSTKKGTLSTSCGYEAKHFHQVTNLKYKQDAGNQYSMPLDSQVSYGACFGSYNSYQITDKTAGVYLCKPTKQEKENGDTEIITTTTSGSTPEEACKTAQSIAAKSGSTSDCACQQRGKVNICKVLSAATKPDGTVRDFVLKTFRELAKDHFPEILKCNRETGICEKSKTVSIGVRD